jgi:hypothetical protein
MGGVTKDKSKVTGWGRGKLTWWGEAEWGSYD